MFLLLAPITLLFASALPQLEAGLALERAGRLDEAHAAFDAIEPESPLYPAAYLELQKIHYRRAEWNRFFGYAKFYRERLVSAFQEPALLQLEGLALAKHCQFAAATGIIGIARESRLDARGLERLQTIEDLIELQTKLPGNVSTVAVKAPFKALGAESQWKIDEARRAEILKRAVNSPRAMRVYVRDVCPAGARKEQS